MDAGAETAGDAAVRRVADIEEIECESHSALGSPFGSTRLSAPSPDKEPPASPESHRTPATRWRLGPRAIETEGGAAQSSQGSPARDVSAAPSEQDGDAEAAAPAPAGKAKQTVVLAEVTEELQ